MKLILTGILLLALTGCAGSIQFTQEVAQANLQRVEAEKIIAQNFMTTYCTWDGPKIRALLGPDINKLPGEIKAQMDELDMLCKATPVNLPQWWGLYQRYAVSIVLEAIKKYVPEVFGQITKFLAIGAGI